MILIGDWSDRTNEHIKFEFPIYLEYVFSIFLWGVTVNFIIEIFLYLHYMRGLTDRIKRPHPRQVAVLKDPAPKEFLKR